MQICCGIRELHATPIMFCNSAGRTKRKLNGGEITNDFLLPSTILTLYSQGPSCTIPLSGRFKLLQRYLWAWCKLNNGLHQWRTNKNYSANNFMYRRHFICCCWFLKGTVRPDWICMRMVSLESPLKGHQPLYVFNFLFLILNIL